MRTSLTTVAASIVLACVLAVGPASAATSYPTKVTISKSQPFWHGTVLSSRIGGVRSCEQKRTVKVYRRQDGKDLLIGTDVSNRSGRWVIPDEPTKGIYYAKVTTRRPADKPACARDQSSIQVVD